MAAWTLLVGVPVAYDVWADRHRPQGTLTALAKWLLRAETPPGRLVSLAAWCGLTYWFLPHLWRLTVEPVARAIEEASNG